MSKEGTTYQRQMAVTFLRTARAARIHDEPAWVTFRRARLEAAGVGLELLYHGASERAHDLAVSAHLLDDRQGRAMRVEAVAA